MSRYAPNVARGSSINDAALILEKEIFCEKLKKLKFNRIWWKFGLDYILFEYQHQQASRRDRNTSKIFTLLKNIKTCTKKI